MKRPWVMLVALGVMIAAVWITGPVATPTRPNPHQWLRDVTVFYVLLVVVFAGRSISGGR